MRLVTSDTAILNGHEEIAIFLLECGADAELMVKGESLLDWAERYNRAEVVAYLEKSRWRAHD